MALKTLGKMGLMTYTVDEVSKHNTEKDCWIIVQGKVFDMSEFLAEHPGGKKVVLNVAGKDASKQFQMFHNQAILDKYATRLQIGVVGDEVVAAENCKNEEPEAEVDLNDPVGEQIPYGDPSWYFQDWVSPYYKDSHRKVRAAVRAFVEKDIIPYCFEWDEKKKIPAELYKKAGSLGVLASITGCAQLCPEYIPEKLPGGVSADEFDNFHEFVVCDELSRCGAGGVTWGLMGGLGIGLPPILKFGGKHLKDKVAKDCLAGRKFICLAITEPAAGSDVANLVTEARKTPDGKHYIVNGEKKWITNGVFADYFTVAVRTGGPGAGGLSLLLIERSMPGVKTRQMQCSGVWCSGTTYITFEDVKVPVENLIGKENSGFKYIMQNFNHERMGIAIQACRFSRVCLEESIKYSHKRKTFGKRLIDHPVIRNKIANMAHKVEATHAWMESLIFQTVEMPADLQMMKLGGPIALLKAQSGQVFEFCAREAAQIFGGLAYSRGGQGEKIERLYREVRAFAIPGGSEEIMLDLGVRQALKVAQIFGTKL